MPCQTNNTANSFYAHLLPQQLNNCGARHIENGNYERAITALVKALKIWEQEADDGNCSRSSSSSYLDECILRCANQSQQKSSSSSSTASATAACAASLVKGTCDDERFIYRQPIYSTNDNDDEENDSPGATLSLIIILNLAMAHHVSAISNQKPICRKRLQKALQLYELAHQLQIEEGISSPRATMIIANNVGEIHRAVQNHKKHIMCLQHLLSTMMFMIDCHIPENSVELEGFLRNTSQLILHDNCAGAA